MRATRTGAWFHRLTTPLGPTLIVENIRSKSSVGRAAWISPAKAPSGPESRRVKITVHLLISRPNIGPEITMPTFGLSRTSWKYSRSETLIPACTLSCEA